MGLLAFQPPLANWLKSWQAEALRSMLARSKPGSDSAFDAPAAPFAFDPRAPFWLCAAGPADPAINAAAASAHNAVTNLTRTDFMFEDSSQNIFLDCSGGNRGMPG